MNVLIISPEQWDAHTVSKHHYAITLAERGFTVFFLNPPVDSISGIHIDKAEGIAGLHIVSSPKLRTGLRFYPAFIRRYLEKCWLTLLEKNVGQKIDIIWLFENSRFFDMRFAGKRLKIYHQVDLNQNFHPESAAYTADICFSTTDFISQRLQPYSSYTYKIQHGLSVSKNQVTLTIKQLEKFVRDSLNAVYVGNLEMRYIDTQLLAGIARKYNHIKFHFVGGYKDDGLLRKSAGGLANVIWWGKVSCDLIPAILAQTDILLVTYQAVRYRDQANPHKFMQYFASGKTIVATYTDEYKDKRHLLEMVDDSRDYIKIFEKVSNNLSAYNSAEKQAQRKAFAQAHTYDKQLDKIFDLLRKHQ